MKSHILKTLAGVAITTLAFVGLAATPASAGTGTCTAGYTCIWQYKDYEGAWAQMLNSNTSFNFNMTDGASASGRASAVSANHTTACRSFLYDSTNYTGNYIYFFKAGSTLGASRDPDLSNGGGNGPYSTQNWDNRIKSNQYTSSC